MHLAPNLLALLPKPLLRALLQRALHDDTRQLPPQWTLHPVNNWNELGEALQTGITEAVVVDPYADRDGDVHTDRTLDDLRWEELARRAPDVVMIAYGDFPRYPARDVLRLAAAGVHEVVTQGVDDDAFTFRQMLAGAASAALARRVASRMAASPLARRTLARRRDRVDSGFSGSVVWQSPLWYSSVLPSPPARTWRPSPSGAFGRGGGFSAVTCDSRVKV